MPKPIDWTCRECGASVGDDEHNEVGDEIACDTCFVEIEAERLQECLADGAMQ